MEKKYKKQHSARLEKVKGTDLMEAKFTGEITTKNGSVYLRTIVPTTKKYNKDHLREHSLGKDKRKIKKGDVVPITVNLRIPKSIIDELATQKNPTIVLDDIKLETVKPVPVKKQKQKKPAEINRLSKNYTLNEQIEHMPDWRKEKYLQNEAWFLKVERRNTLAHEEVIDIVRAQSGKTDKGHEVIFYALRTVGTDQSTLGDSRSAYILLIKNPKGKVIHNSVITSRDKLRKTITSELNELGYKRKQVKLNRLYNINVDSIKQYLHKGTITVSDQTKENLERLLAGKSIILGPLTNEELASYNVLVSEKLLARELYFSKTTLKERLADEKTTEKIVTDVEQWSNNIEKTDFPGIDVAMPSDYKLISNFKMKKTPEQQTGTIIIKDTKNKNACFVSFAIVEVEINNKKRYRLDIIDSFFEDENLFSFAMREVINICDKNRVSMLTLSRIRGPLSSYELSSWGKTEEKTVSGVEVVTRLPQN